MNEEQNTQQSAAVPPPQKRNVWIDKYKIPVYTDLKRADEILYAADTQVLGRNKKNYFAMVNLNAPTEEIAQEDFTKTALGVAARAAGAGLPGGFLAYKLKNTPLMRGALKMAVEGTRQTAAGTLKQAGAGAVMAGMDTETRLKRNGLLSDRQEGFAGGLSTPEGFTRTDAWGPAWQKKTLARFKEAFPDNLIDEEYIKARLSAFKKEQAKIDDFNGKVKNITDHFTKAAGLEKTEKDGFMYDFGAGAASFLFSVGALAVTRNPALVAPIFGIMEGQGTYEQAVEAGVPADKAYLLGNANALWITATEAVGESILNKLLFTKGVLGKAARRIVQRVKGKGTTKAMTVAGAIGSAQGAALEATQEAVQNIGSDLLANAGGAQDKRALEIIQDAVYAGLLAGPLGGLAGGVGGAAHVSVAAKNVQERLENIGVPTEMAAKLGQETALESFSSELVDDTISSVKGEINSPLTAEDRNPAAFKSALTQAQKREVQENAWAVGERVEQQALEAGIAPEKARANGAVAAALSNGIFSLAKLTPTEQEQFKINIVRGGKEPAFRQAQTFNQLPAEAYDKNGKADINTPQFKEWFGDSKVVDENGRPLVVYHGTASKFFNKFDTFQTPSWFSSTQEYAERYSNSRKEGILSKKRVYPVYISIKNPLYVGNINRAFDSGFNKEDFYKELSSNTNIDIEEIKSALKELDTVWLYRITSNPAFVSLAKKYGYDGLIAEEYGVKTFSAFFPEQIKSVYNRGAWDKNNPNIFYQSAYHGTPHRFDNFSTAHIGTGEGAQAHGWGLYFAQSKEVSEKYRQKLQHRIKKHYTFLQDGKELPADVQSVINNEVGGHSVYLAAKGDLEELRASIKRVARSLADPNEPHIKIANELTRAKEGIIKNPKMSISKFLADNTDYRFESIAKSARLIAKNSGRKANISDVLSVLNGHLEVFNKAVSVQRENANKLLSVDLDKLTVREEQGQLFEVDIPENDVLLDEDKTFNEQPEKVREALKRLAGENESKLLRESISENETGKSMYRAMVSDNMAYLQDHNEQVSYSEAAKNASELLLMEGVQGITYNGGRDGRAYVIFDDKAIDVINTFYQQAAQDMFEAQAQVAARFKEEVRNILADEDIPKGTVLDMGDLPGIYVELGLPQGSLKTNKTTLLKAIGKSGRHPHSVPRAVLENLPALVADPKAVFKSSPASTNPDGYVAVLDAVNEEGKQIIAAISPNNKGAAGFSFIPSVYDKDNFANFVLKTQQENGILYVKEKDSDIWGTLQSRPLHNQSPTNSIRTKEDIVKGAAQTFEQGPRGQVSIDTTANEAIIRIFETADASTIVHELAHVYLTMIARAARVSADTEFGAFMDDLNNWLGAPDENGEYSRKQQEKFANYFEAYLAEGKAPNKELESVFEKFARWLAEVYAAVKDKLELTPEVRRIFDRLLAPSAPIKKSKIGQKLDSAKRLVEQMKKGSGQDVEGVSLAELKELIGTLSVRKPAKPQSTLLKDLRKHGAEYANAGKIDKESYKNARIYDKKGGVDDEPDVWLQKRGYMDFEESTPETEEAAWNLIQRALDGEDIYRQEDQARAEERAAYEENMATLLQVFPDIKTAQETLKAIAALEEQGYRAVEKKDLDSLAKKVQTLEQMVLRLESEELKAKAGALDKKALQLEEEAKRLKRQVISELDKRMLAEKEAMKRLLAAAQTPQEIHAAAAGVLRQLESAWEKTEEGQKERRKLEVPNTNWDAKRVQLLKGFNEVMKSAGEEVSAAQKTLAGLFGKILSEEDAKAKEKAERVLKTANLEGRLIRVMQDIMRGEAHISPADIYKMTAYLAKSQVRNRLNTEYNISRFLDEFRKAQERNYKKYMQGKISGLFSRKVFEKVGSARRMKYNKLAAEFLQEGAAIWHGSQERAEKEYAAALDNVDPANPPDSWTALLNNVLALKADPKASPMSAFYDLYQTALAALRGDSASVRLEKIRKTVNEENIRLAAEASLEERKIPTGTKTFLLHGGTDFQTMLSVLFGTGEYDALDKNGALAPVRVDFRKELSTETQQMRAAVFNHNAQKQLMAAIQTAYGLSSADEALSKTYELQNDKMEVINYGWIKDEQEAELVSKIYKRGKTYSNNRPRKQTINREEIITFWLWEMDHDFQETKDGVKDYGLSGRLRRAYGNDQLERMFAKLTPQDKQYGRNLQKMLKDVHALESETHRRIYGFPLPSKENYFPSVTERQTDAIDYKQQILDNAKSPSFIKTRVKSRMPVQKIVSPTKLVLSHMRRASEFIFEAEKYTELRRIFLQSDMEDAFLNKFGSSDGKKIYGKLKDLLVQQGPAPSKTADELFAVSNKLFNGWVKSVLGLKVMTGIKQFASSVSFAENMPADTWALWFAEGLKNPLKTAQWMKNLSPYIQVRYETGGVNEAVSRAMTADEVSPVTTKWNNFTNLFLLNTRMGDKASLIYGGYPYMRYLIEVEKLSPEAAAEKFEIQAVRTLQSSLKANLSMGQANAENLAARFFLTFKNQQMQYVRRLADVYVQYKNGEATAAQFAKTAFLYLVLNPVVYTALGIGYWADDEDDRERDMVRLATSPVTQFFDAWPFGGGVADMLLENTWNVIRGKKLSAPNQAGLPMLDDFLRDVSRVIKTINTEQVETTEAMSAWLEFVKYFGLPYGTLTNYAGGVKDLFTGEPVRGTLKLVGYSKNRAEKITGTQEKKRKKKIR